jgi:hypothetical protein
MKFYETHFDEYINKTDNLHKKLEKIYKKFPDSLTNLKNIIYYGANGIGKYTQMLKSIQKYSPSKLKYEKKIILTYNKIQYSLKISDIHYEVDMSLLGCNAKIFWHKIYQQIIDIISSKNEKSGIIICKNFHEIHCELLDIFYSYMQQNTSTVDLKFIILTKELSFIPNNILNCCQVIHIERPNYHINEIPIENITNIKNLYSNSIYTEELMLQYKIICNKIIYNIINVNTIHFLKFRDLLYDIFIYNLDITECIWYILSNLIKKEKIKIECISNVLIETYSFFQYYNNNYRPIYHLEKYLLYLVNIIHFKNA